MCRCLVPISVPLCRCTTKININSSWIIYVRLPTWRLEVRPREPFFFSLFVWLTWERFSCYPYLACVSYETAPKAYIYIYESVWDSGSPFFVFVLGMLSKFIWIFKCVANRKSIALNTRRMNSQHLRCLCHMHQNMQRFWDLFVSGSLSFQHFIHKFHLIQDLGRFFMACKDESCWICTKNNKILPKIVVIQPPQATISSHKDVAV